MWGGLPLKKYIIGVCKELKGREVGFVEYYGLKRKLPCLHYRFQMNRFSIGGKRETYIERVDCSK